MYSGGDLSINAGGKWYMVYGTGLQLNMPQICFLVYDLSVCK